MTGATGLLCMPTIPGDLDCLLAPLDPGLGTTGYSTDTLYCGTVNYISKPATDPGCWTAPASATPPPAQSAQAAGCWDWSCMPAALAQALIDLQNPDCAKNFNGHDARAVLASIVGCTKYGHVVFATINPASAATITDQRGFLFFNRSVLITINEFTSPAAVYWNAGNAQVNAITLIHELGHAFQWLFGQQSTTIVPDANPNGSPNAGLEAANAKALQPCNKL